MARPRSDTATLTREGHSVSLKVLRLLKPSLTQQHPLPHNSTANIPHKISLAYPSESVDQDFTLTTNLALPPSFGAAYIGETFSCAISANNELAPQNATKTVSNIRLTAEMQTPSQTFPLELNAFSDPEASADTNTSIPGSSVQRIIQFDLREEGNHTLVINVQYSETNQSAGSTATSGRARTFRKMYQFVAQPCLSVRTKSTELPPTEVSDKSLGPYGRSQLLRYLLEAQLENVSDTRIVLEEAKLQERAPFKSTSLNGNFQDRATDDNGALNPRDVLQIAFLVEQIAGATAGVDRMRAELKQDGRTVLGQLALQWRSPMGEKGSLNTGNLLTRRKQ